MARRLPSLQVPFCVFLIAIAALGACARNLDGTLGLILRPVSTVPGAAQARWTPGRGEETPAGFHVRR